MKKVLISICLLLIVSWAVFATGFEFEDITGKIYRPVYVNDTDHVDYSLFDNPACLASDTFEVSIPKVSLNLNHFSGILTDFSEDIVNLQNISGTSDLLGIGYKILEHFPAGRSELLTANVGAGFRKNHFGLSLNINAKINTFADSNRPEVTNISLLPVVDAALSLGYGRRVADNGVVSLDAGISVHAFFKGYTAKVGASEIISIVDAEGGLNLTEALKKADTKLGYKISLDAGIALNFNNPGIFSIELSAHNFIPTPYTMYRFGHGESDVSLIDGDVDLGAFLVFDSEALSLIDNNLYVHGRVGLDSFVPAINGFSLKDCFAASVSARLFKSAEVTYSYEHGFSSYGVGFNVYGNRIELMYGWHSEECGPSDSLTITCALGYAK